MKLLVLTATALFAFAAGSCQAVPIYFTGFDNPPFTLGPINGQAGWFVFSASGQTSDPVIENTVVQSGTAGRRCRRIRDRADRPGVGSEPHAPGVRHVG